MQRKKTIGLCTPARDATGFHAYQGIFPPGVLAELTHALAADGRADIIGQVDLAKAYIKNDRVYAENICLSDLDLLFWFHILPLGNHAFDLQILKTLSRHTRVLPNPHHIENGLDKFNTHTVLSRAGVATPEFCLFRSDNAERMTHLLGEWGALVLKPRLGSFGHGVSKITAPQQLLDAVQYAASFSREPVSIFCERFEPHDISRWISVTVIDGAPVFGYRKRPSRIVDGWKIYDAGMVGGEADYVDFSATADLAREAAKALGCDIIGFDFIYSTRQDRYLIVDANTVPGLYQDCFAQTGKSWAQHFAGMILAHALR